VIHGIAQDIASDDAARALAGARCVAILTGAGISAESGVPTFRDAQTGLWARFDPLQLATPTAFANNPKLVWDWYAWRRELVAKVEPNPAHYSLVDIECRVPDCLVITQNVDGLHRRAGTRNVVELHGNIGRVKCSREGTVVARWDRADDEVPRCAACGALLRPDVVWFDERLPPAALADAEAMARRCDLMLVVGTSGEVYPAAALPSIARTCGAFVIEINPGVTALSASVDCALRGPAGSVLPALVRKAWPDMPAKPVTPGGRPPRT
jgi:NAD-dependent protein deacetylase/lipoamidase